MIKGAFRTAGITIPLLLTSVTPSAAGSPMPDETKIEVGELVFDALVAGPDDGPVVFMLHGFPQAAFEWRHQMPVLASMGFRVIAPNQRGYSPGARPDGVDAYTVPNLVADVIGLADAVGADTFHVVGHDWGAAVAWFAGLMHPDRVLSLVPISVPHPYAFGQALADPEGQQAKMSGYMEVFRSEEAEDLFLANDAAMLRGIYGGAGLISDEVQEYVDVLGTRDAIGAALNWYRAMNLATGAGEVTPIAMPTMYVWSTDDMALGREGAELTADFIEGPYRFEIIEGVGHWVPEEAAGELNELLQEHFAPFAASGDTTRLGTKKRTSGS
ncbi:MAG TPA: alpha/beta hydrolase [Acidobacteriota bacterium]|nr:alpha/beta hydrolase [Acidobacteriota bacterium]